MTDGSSITALLGPTNTGKTHRAVERMLEHESGMIGLPLRLLAREVYDRVTARVGEQRVALVTGEEKRIPRRPDYWICTVEAMPSGVEVDFVAIDEVQLAAHAQRGHVFTERLLLARGRRETYLLGSDTMRPLMAELVPAARIVQHPRLSRLSPAGAHKLSHLPPRTAVVGFSMAQVYELGERLRALRGGAAIVLGALSPRTRNAQVALFQAGEVDYLVATDAIGMGLNLDLQHVAFAALRKFDGRDLRALDAAELGQIAGRAGRYLADGTFGTLAPLAIPPPVEAALTLHRFDPVRSVRWRNPDLDFSSIDALIASLRAPPRRAVLRPAEEAEDLAALEALTRDPDLRARAQTREGLLLLWDVCRVPDYRKLLFEVHAALLGELFEQLSGPRGALDPAFVERTVRALDDTAGDIDTLIDRIASVRVWTYVSHQTRWVRDAEAWQARTREVEDRLSDALHDRLVQRFVDKRGRRRPAPARPRPSRGEPAPSTDAQRPDHPFAALASLRIPSRSGGGEAPNVAVERIVDAPFEELSLDVSGTIHFHSSDDPARAVGRLTRGTTLLLPEVKLVGLDELGAGARARVARRLTAFARDVVAELLRPFRGVVGGLSAAGRGLVYQLEQGLGTALAAAAAEQIRSLTAEDRAAMLATGVVVGDLVVFAPALLGGAPVAHRAALTSAFFAEGAPPAPRPGTRSFAAKRADPRACIALGFPVFGRRAVRADLAERVAKATLSEAAEWLGCSERDASAVVQALASVGI